MDIDPEIAILLIGVVVIVAAIFFVKNKNVILPDKETYYGLSAKAYASIYLLLSFICMLSLDAFTNLNPFFGMPLAIIPVTLVNVVYSKFRLSKTVGNVRR